MKELYIIAFFLLSIAFAAAMTSCSSRSVNAEPYALINGGPIWSEQQSNSDEIEFGSEPDGAVGVEGGYIFGLGPLDVSLGLEAAHHWKDLHGANGSNCTTQRSCSADGETLHLTTVTINVRTERVIYWRLGLYGLIGGGGGYADGLGDSDVVSFAKGEAGILLAIDDNIAAGAGYRHSRAFNVDLDGNSSDLDFYGPVGWLRWRFN